MVSDDIIRQLQVLFPWMSEEELKKMVSKNQAGSVGHGKHGGGGGGAAVGHGKDELPSVPEDVLVSLAAEL